MLTTHHLPGRTIRSDDGHERLYFSGTSYLGMGHNAAFQALLREGLAYYGTIYSSSRASNVQLAVYDEAESRIAQQTGAEAALTFSSGYQAGQAVIQRWHDQLNFYYAPDTHPAVWRSAADAVAGDFSSWASATVEQLHGTRDDAVVVANSLDPLRARQYDFRWVGQLPEERSIILLVDDSHGLGITGEAGGGIFATLQSLAKANVTVLVVSSLGKAFGIPGGVVLGPTDLVNELRSGPFFTAASPLPPAYLYAFVRAQPLYDRARQRLFENVSYFRQLTADLSLFRSLDRYPVFYTADDRLAAAVAPTCVLSSFPYPDPDSELITRVVVSSLHQRADLDTLNRLVKFYLDSSK